MLRAKDKQLHIGEQIKGVYAGRMRATPADRYVAAVLADAPLGFYKCDDLSGLLQDASGNGNHMTTSTIPTGKAYRMAGPFEGAYGVQLTTGGSNFQRAVLTAVQDNWALECWFCQIAEGGDDTILLNGTRASVGYGIDLATGTTKFRCLMGSVAFLTSSTGSYGVFPPLAYKHIVVTRESGTTKYYLNGVSDTANAGTNTPNAPATKSQIGSDGAIAGIWSMCAFYNTALTSARVAAHYAASGL
jgi:hypothetical protein